MVKIFLRLMLLSLIGAICGCDLPRQPGEKPDEPGKATYPKNSKVQAGQLEVVHRFYNQMPTGVTVSHGGRIFVCYPRWEDRVAFTVGEISNGQEVAYPNQQINRGSSEEEFLSVQSVVVDPDDRLWVLDTGSINMGPIKGQQWPKLVAIDLNTNQVIKTIRFPSNVVRNDSYLNDVRFDLRRGQGGMAFITDSSSKGDNGIIVVDLASGRSWRKLDRRPEVQADPNFVAVMEGQPLMIRKPGQPPQKAAIGSDGIAISADGSRLFFCPLSSRELFSVSTDALANEKMSDADVAKTITRERRDFASDGLESDAQGHIYLTDWEHNSVVVRCGQDVFSTLVHDERLWWPDTMSLATDGYLYVTANQLHRQGKFHEGRDLREKPYYLFRIKVNATPVMLRGNAQTRSG